MLLSRLTDPQCSKMKAEQSFDLIVNQCLVAGETNLVENLQQVTQGVFRGELALFINGVARAVLIDLKGYEHRNVSIPETEVVIRGPREGFIEELVTNLILLRRRIKGPQLKVEKIFLGEQSATAVAITYVKGIADDKIVEEAVSYTHLDVYKRQIIPSRASPRTIPITALLLCSITAAIIPVSRPRHGAAAANCKALPNRAEFFSEERAAVIPSSPSNRRPQPRRGAATRRAFGSGINLRKTARPSSGQASRPRLNESSCPVIVVPTLAPMITPQPCATVITRALIKLTTITVVRLLLCSSAVTRKPVPKPRQGLPVSLESNRLNAGPAVRASARLIWCSPPRKSSKKKAAWSRLSPGKAAAPSPLPRSLLSSLRPGRQNIPVLPG